MPHTVLVAYLDHNGGYLIVGTGMGGSKAIPQWFLNLPAGEGHIHPRRGAPRPGQPGGGCACLPRDLLIID